MVIAPTPAGNGPLPRLMNPWTGPDAVDVFAEMPDTLGVTVAGWLTLTGVLARTVGGVYVRGWTAAGC